MRFLRWLSFCSPLVWPAGASLMPHSAPGTWSCQPQGIKFNAFAISGRTGPKRIPLVFAGQRTNSYRTVCGPRASVGFCRLKEPAPTEPCAKRVYTAVKIREYKKTASRVARALNFIWAASRIDLNLRKHAQSSEIKLTRWAEVPAIFHVSIFGPGHQLRAGSSIDKIGTSRGQPASLEP